MGISIKKESMRIVFNNTSKSSGPWNIVGAYETLVSIFFFNLLIPFAISPVAATSGKLPEEAYCNL